ncbi:MAG: hypothetical protein ABIB43_00630 [archaeon]
MGKEIYEQTLIRKVNLKPLVDLKPTTIPLAHIERGTGDRSLVKYEANITGIAYNGRNLFVTNAYIKRILEDGTEDWKLEFKEASIAGSMIIREGELVSTKPAIGYRDRFEELAWNKLQYGMRHKLICDLFTPLEDKIMRLYNGLPRASRNFNRISIKREEPSL